MRIERIDKLEQYEGQTVYGVKAVRSAGSGSAVIEGYVGSVPWMGVQLLSNDPRELAISLSENGGHYPPMKCTEWYTDRAEAEAVVAEINAQSDNHRNAYNAAAPQREAARRARHFASQERQIRREIDEINYCEGR